MGFKCVQFFTTPYTIVKKAFNIFRKLIKNEKPVHHFHINFDFNVFTSTTECYIYVFYNLFIFTVWHQLNSNSQIHQIKSTNIIKALVWHFSLNFEILLKNSGDSLFCGWEPMLSAQAENLSCQFQEKFTWWMRESYLAVIYFVK